MTDFEYRVAHDLDQSWLNFDPDRPLVPAAEGEENAFYVRRPDTAMQRCKRILLRDAPNRPKHFLSGHKGCGKSTELYRLAADPDMRRAFWPVHFSIRHHTDINDLDFKDVLLVVGEQLFQQYQEHFGKQLDKDLRGELERWQGTLTEEITFLQKGRMEGELSGKISSLFAELTGKIKIEPATRHQIRQILDRNITGLVRVIDQIARAAEERAKKPVLIMIDDLDKPDLAVARQIFFDRQQAIFSPNCAIVYTISSPLFYDGAFRNLNVDYTFLPNVKLHDAGDRDRRHAEGYLTLRNFIHVRLIPELLGGEALELAIKMSGGVFRELARIMRGGSDWASARGERAQIKTEDVRRAANEIRNEYRRILTVEQLTLLAEVRRDFFLRDPSQQGELLQMLAVLEYMNGDVWYDVHPVLHLLLDRMMQDDGSG